ncbi:hypothetical protein EV200_10722 [Pedobacter psychrotolerans]|nr:hypothetical protein [Pedobacter psychrotolerans]TCO21433.1 hypothetical protein EV200_10722 [Pedobacter psychrotolerans]
MLSTFKLNTLLENPSLVIAEITSDIPSSSDATAENNWILLEKSSGKITRLTQQLKTSESQYNFYEGQLSLNATTGNFLFRHGLKWEVLDLNIEKSLSADLIVIIQHFVDLFTDHEHLSLAACPALDFGYEIIKNDNQANLKSFNLSIKFVFNPAGHFSFDPNASEVKNNKEVAIRDAELVMTSYEAILAQILASDIEISVSNTLNPGQLIPLNANLANENNGFSDFLTLVINWIKNFIAQPDEQNLFAADHESPLAASPIHYVWNSAQELSNPQKLFPLEVHLVTQRKLSNLQSQHQVVDPAKPAINTGVEENLTIVKPYSLINLYGMEEPDQQISVLKQFTQGVENILNPMDVKLAISVPGEGSSLIDGNFSELWVMRMKDLLDHCHTPSDSIKDLEHQYYSIAPFSTTLLNSSAAEIYTFEHYLGQTDISTTYQLTDIDLETLTERFLHDVQLMRSKPVLEALALIDGQSNKIPSKHIGYLQQQVTENLADRIVSQLRPLMIIPDPKTTKIAGTEKFKKALLTDLHCAYTSAFLLPVNINPLCYDQSAESYLPLAFTSFPSQLSAADDNSDNGLQDAITIPGVTSAHHPHQNDAYLAYGNADLRRHSSIRMKADLDIKQIMITNAAPDPDQSTIPESIGWLSIILPGDALSSLSLEETVPNPVKKYPDQVSLISQTFFDEPLQENIKTPDIAALLSTGFAFKYRLNEFQLQDCYQFEITFNSMNDQSAALKVHSSIEPSLENFLHKIFQFNMVSPQFMAYFEQELPKIQQDITTTELPTLQKLLKAFWKLAGEVVSLWPSVTDVTTPAPPLSPSVSQRMISFQVREWASIQPNGEALFESVISDWKSGISDYNFFLLPELEGWTAEPQLSIDGKGITPIPMGMEGSKQIAIRYFSTSGNEKKYLSFEEGAEIVSRRIALYQLHLPGIQNINTSISILRNTGLNNHLTTDKHFVYQAQPISFAHEAVPNKIIQENINWPDLVPPQNLEAHINNIFKLLSTQQNPGNLPLFIQIEIQLKTKLLANDFSPEISIPILLIPEEKFVDGAINEALSTKISEGILTWFSATNPSVDLSTLSFSIQIFSDTLQNLTPLIVLENIRLNIANIPDIMAAVKN